MPEVCEEGNEDCRCFTGRKCRGKLALMPDNTLLKIALVLKLALLSHTP